MKIGQIMKLQLPVQPPWKCMSSEETSLSLSQAISLAENLWHLPNLWCLQFSKRHSEQVKIYIHAIEKKMAKIFLWYLFRLLHLFQLIEKRHYAEQREWDVESGDPTHMFIHAMESVRLCIDWSFWFVAL